MPNCPKCRQVVASDAVTCPTCRNALKAFGHPGIPLYQAIGDAPLCQTCLYDADNSCTYPQRPEAQNCTMYQNMAAQPSSAGSLAGPQKPATAQYATFPSFAWWRRNPAWAGFLGLFIVIFLVKLAGVLK